MSDAIFTLNYMFLGTAFPPCPLADSLEILEYVTSLEAELHTCKTVSTTLTNDNDVIRSELEAVRLVLTQTRNSLAEVEALLDTCINKYPGPTYNVIGIGHLPGTLKHTVARALNNAGTVVGFAGLGSRAFLWLSNELQDLGHLEGGTESQAYGISNTGVAVGLTSTPLGARPFLFNQGTMTGLPIALGSTGGWATAVNDQGQVVGVDGGAVLWDNGIRFQIDRSGSYAYGINNVVQIVGSTSTTFGSETRAFMWQNEILTNLGTLPGGQFSVAYDINDNGLIVGSSSLPFEGSGAHPSRAVVWKSSSSSAIDLGTPQGRSVQAAEARAVNIHGQVVGRMDLGFREYEVGRAFIWDEQSGMRDLNDLIDPCLRWTLQFALDINEAGQIVGFGTNPQGYVEAFLLTPTPDSIK